MATYQKTPSGNWKAIVRLKGFPKQTKTFPTKPNAMEWALAVEAGLRSVNTHDGDIPAFSDVEVLYKADAKKRMKLPEKENLYFKLFKNLFEKRNIFTLTPYDLECYIEDRLEHVTEDTIRKDILFISRYYNFIIRKLKVKVDNPVKFITIPSKGKARDRVASDEELRRLYDNISERMAIVFEFAVETAMRRNEIANLDWSWVHINRRCISLPEFITKNGEARNVPLSTRAIQLLMQLGIRKFGSVFDVTVNGITSAMYRGCIRAHIKGLRFHDLRHTAITRYARKGWTTVQLRVLSGHKTLSQLERYVNMGVDDVIGLMG